MTGPLHLGVDIFRFFDALESDKAALWTDAASWSSIISSAGYREDIEGRARIGGVLGRRFVGDFQA